MKLYEIGGQYSALAEALNNPEADNDAVIAELDRVTEAFDRKAISVAKVIRNYEMSVLVLEEEIERLQDRRARMKKRMDGLKSYLLTQMQAVGVQRIDDEILPLSRRINPPSVNVLDESSIPDLYFKEKVVRTLDKKSVAAAIKEGGSVPGAELVRTERVVVG